MKFLAGVLLAAASVASAAEGTLNVRLLSRLTSFSTPKGTTFEATVISDTSLNGAIVIPVGSIVRGRVTVRHSIGAGLVRERAELGLQFFEYQLPDGRVFACTARLKRVDNAREQTTKAGTIKGILAAGGAPGLARGLWRLPDFAMLSRPAERLLGYGPEFWPHMGFGPIGSAGLFVFRWVALRFPEPEISLPAGTEMTLQLTESSQEAPVFQATSLAIEPAGEWTSISRRITRGRGKECDDVINVVLEGTRTELMDAFGAAGWVEADPLTRSTFMKVYRAWTSQKGYATAPVSTLLYQDRQPDVVLQKSLNTVNRRHHIRLWQVPGRDVWVAAATHDVGVSLNPSLRVLTHKIDLAIDRERHKVFSDLRWVGAVEEASLLNTDLPEKDQLGIRTDGRMLKVKLKPVEHEHEIAGIGSVDQHPFNPLVRMTRRFALETRQYVLRDNYFYWGFRGIRAGRASVMHRTRHDEFAGETELQTWTAPPRPVEGQ